MASLDAEMNVLLSVEQFSLRDWFAGQALPFACQMQLAQVKELVDAGVLKEPTEEIEAAIKEGIAAEAYKIADAMLEARKARVPA